MPTSFTATAIKPSALCSLRMRPPSSGTSTRTLSTSQLGAPLPKPSTSAMAFDRRGVNISRLSEGSNEAGVVVKRPAESQPVAALGQIAHGQVEGLVCEGGVQARRAKDPYPFRAKGSVDRVIGSSRTQP
eukprot:8529573-Pyramimonas_sp.AAC.3